MDEKTAKIKKQALVHRLKEFDSLLVAFSGGVDSAFLLAMAHHTLKEKVVAATATSNIHAMRENESARAFALERNIKQIIFQSEEMSLPDFVSNNADRCYYCKRHLFQALLNIAGEKGIRHVAHGANLDDMKDYRPGFRAADEAGVTAPLIEAQLSKGEIRFLSKEMGLKTWDKPSTPCLATRIPYGSPVTKEKLRMIEKAEDLLLKLGVEEARVRHHGSVARIEISLSKINSVMEKESRNFVIEKFRKIGFKHVALDLEGYISGKMNRILEK